MDHSILFIHLHPFHITPHIHRAILRILWRYSTDYTNATPGQTRSSESWCYIQSILAWLSRTSCPSVFFVITVVDANSCLQSGRESGHDHLHCHAPQFCLPRYVLDPKSQSHWLNGSKASISCCPSVRLYLSPIPLSPLNICCITQSTSTPTSHL